jgi:hypothetical protein
MGVTALYFVDYVVKVSLLSKCWRLIPYPLIPLTVASSSLLMLLYFLSDARSALPMGVAPEAIAEKFFPGIGSKDINSS